MKREIKQMNDIPNRTLTLMRGIPGSGKSTKAKELSAVTGGKICSTDDYFMVGDRYVFDISKIAIAHFTNQAKVRGLMAVSVDHIIVDNTNTTRKEMKPYVKMANEFGYKVEYITVECDVETSIARNTHNVPPDVIRKMAARFQKENEVPTENV